MSPKPVAIRSYSFSSSDRLLLDANIWFFVYGPQDPKDYRVPIYSLALKNMLAAQSRLYVDVLVLSEFINRYARMEYEMAIKRGFTGNFKRYRKSADYKPISQAIAASAHRILAQSQRLGSGFETVNIDALLSDFGTNCKDFNDLIIAELGRAQGITLVTDDADFKGVGIPILTANAKLLS
jgi:predicted nucleic acid-binding protein